MWVETFTGLRMKQFERLLKVVRERGGDGPRIGRPWCLPLADRVLVVAAYYRTNLTMRQLAPLFGVSPATVRRVIHRLRPLLALEPASRPVDAADRLWIVDGTLVPVHDRKVGASSRNYRFSANVQVINDAHTRLVVATARPAPGNRADTHVWRDSGLPQHCQGVTVLGDGASINTGLVVPHRKRPGRRGSRQRGAPPGPCAGRACDRPAEELQDPARLPAARRRLHHAVRAVTHMHNLALAT
ncbi:Transposase DDE domain-containing protein [Streptomyces sp. OK228]|nr:Transposase DDE domain-containing protein [Streptomyces sp. OK228]